MYAQLIRIVAPARRHMSPIAPTRNGEQRPSPATQSTTTLGSTPVQLVLHQLVQSLTILQGAAEQVLQGTATGPTIQTLQRWLPPTARQAEGAMQRLRELPLAKSSLVIDLSQALTVLVLAADMLAQGQLSTATDVDLYVLLRRNAGRAMQSLDALYSQLVANT
jgi:hypothetical protein